MADWRNYCAHSETAWLRTIGSSTPKRRVCLDCGAVLDDVVDPVVVDVVQTDANADYYQQHTIPDEAYDAANDEQKATR